LEVKEMKIGGNKTVTQTTEELTNEAVVVSTATTEEQKLYWKFEKMDNGDTIIRVFRPEEQQRISEMVEEMRLEYIARCERLENGLAHATLKAEMIDQLITDNKRTKVRAGASLLFGNNIEVIAERHEIENPVREKKEPTGKYVKTEKIVNDNRLSI
jgi:hypothetical protein